ncbi:MetQ/NlpA family ABC transporter substrate-binding protein, partial [Klebsiella pneumoniae]|nr:MetQ/NlpA family ABC transporter substrate-binding protein [Klebsiella pneumoniae]
NPASYRVVRTKSYLFNKAGMSLTSALKLEAATSHFINVVTVAGKNQKAQFAKDIIDGYHSAEFKKYILSHPQYDGYLLPDYLK